MTSGPHSDCFQKLLDNFASQEEAHTGMLSAIDEGEEALRTGRIDLFVEACRRQQSLAIGMQRLESDRMDLIRSFPSGRGGGRDSIDSIIAEAPEELGQRIRHAIDRLRPLVHQTRQRCAVVRNAVGALSKHMSGLLQGVYGVLGRPGTYGRLGTIARENQLEFNVDLQS